MRTVFRSALLGVLLGAGACGTSGNSAPPEASPDAAARPDAAAGSPAPVVGAFLVEIKPPAGTAAGSTTLTGKVADGPTPATVVLELVRQVGDCRLLTPRAPFCSPRCGGSDLCVADNRCAPFPKSQNLGPVEVRGLGAAPFTMDPIANTYQLPGDLTLPFPPAAEGAAVQLLINGGPFGAFTLTSRAVAPLSWADNLTLERGKPIALTWTPATMPDVGRVQIRVEISHHGGSKGEIDCQVADTGSAQVPAELVTKLIDLGVAGFPAVTLTRIATGLATIAPGQIELQVLSTVTREVTVAGSTSCNETKPCPGGKICRDDQTCAP